MNFEEYLVEKKTNLHIVPGTHFIKFLDNLNDECKNNISIWRTEQGAGYGAIASSLLCETPASLIVTAGPGITNVATVLAQAYSDRIPLVVYGINNWASTLNKRVGTVHELGYTCEIFKSFTFKAVSIGRPEELCEKIDNLYNEAKLYRLPVYVEIPSDIFDLLCLNDFEYVKSKSFFSTDDNELLKRCTELINQAKMPAFFCGYGAMDASVSKSVIELSELLNIPIITTLEASSFIDHKDNNIGSLWDRIFIKNEDINGVDAVLAIGCDLGVMDTTDGKLKLRNYICVTSKLICHYIYDEKICECDVADLLQKLIALSHQGKIAPKDKKNIDVLMEERKRQLNQYYSFYSCGKVLRDIQKIYPKETVFCSDVFLEGYAFGHFWDITRKQRLIASHNFLNLGFSIGASVGALLAGFDAVCMVGDGGVSYGMTEISTALKYNKKIRLIIFNNNCYGTIERYARDNKQIYDLENPDFELIAQAYNLKYLQTNGNDIMSIIEDAERCERGYVIEVNFEEETPMFNKLKWK